MCLIFWKRPKNCEHASANKPLELNTVRHSHRFFAAGLIIAGSLGATAARASTYDVTVSTGDVGGTYTATAGSAALFTKANKSQEAKFTYTGPLDFSDTASQNHTATGDLNSMFFGDDASGITNYRSIVTATKADYGSFATLSGFLSSSGSVSGTTYGSLYDFAQSGSTLGEVLTITHDDGVGVYVDGVLQSGTTTGPTVAVTETVALPAGSMLDIVYARENGTPSVLEVAVPEPVSLSLLGVGLFGLAAARRRRSA